MGTVVESAARFGRMNIPGVLSSLEKYGQDELLSIFNETLYHFAIAKTFRELVYNL